MKGGCIDKYFMYLSYKEFYGLQDLFKGKKRRIRI